MEEMDQREKDVKTGQGSTQLEGRVGHGNEKVGWVRNVGFATRVVLGAMQQDRGWTVREVGRETRSLKRSESDTERKRPRTSRAVSKTKTKRSLWSDGSHTHTHTQHTYTIRTHTHTN
jgi:hypothetical protein